MAGKVTRSGAPRRRVYRAGPLEKLAERLAPSRGQTVFWLVLAGVGFLLLVNGWMKAEQIGVAHGPAAGGANGVQVLVEGSLPGVDGLQPKAQQVVLELPEIPLRLEFEGGEVLSAEGRIKLKAEFDCRRRPTYCRLTLKGPGEPRVWERLPLAGEPLRAELQGRGENAKSIR